MALPGFLFGCVFVLASSTMLVLAFHLIACPKGIVGMNVKTASVHNLGHQILNHGLLLVMVGLLWGFVVPLAPYPRLALGAHIQFVTNGLLLLVMAIMLLKLPHHVGPMSAWIMLLSAWLTWLMALSEAANAWWGANQMLPIAADQAGATGGMAWQELVVKLTHLAAGLGLVIAWGRLVAGFMRSPTLQRNQEDPDPAEQSRG
jgi:(hydroxyamino)benzene mutase